jgi:hypothetical protein
MNMGEALSAAVDGEKVRAVNMAAGVYIDYHFNGWRINLPGGASSGWHSTEHDNVEWEVYVKPEPQGWDMSAVKPVVAPEPVKRRGRKAWVPPAEINDIDDAKPEPKPSNPWLEAGLTTAEKPVSGWGDYGKGTNQ